MAYKTPTELAQEFAADYRAALNPCICCAMDYFDGEDERQEVADLIEVLLTNAESPPYSPVQMRRIEERMQPIFDRAMKDPAVVADRDQREAEWRDKPRRVKLWYAIRWRMLCLRMRLSLVGKKPRWE